MHEQVFQLTIKPAEASHLEVLEHEFDPDELSKPHYRRYEVQKRGEGVYLIAWHEHIPVGHFLLRWSGPDGVTTFFRARHTLRSEAAPRAVLPASPDER